ncbi:MAG: flavoprotein [Alistipes sp.]|uniref:flavoprotein n=1 Tax=Alistipes sp. TaxID=1872444 RepID=UPI00399287D0
MDSQGHDIQSPGAGRTVEGLAGRRILLGITGSIAAYKAAVLCRLLKCAGAEVRVVMTPLAKQFITPLTMATLSKNPILVEFFDPENGAWNSHVSLGEWPLLCARHGNTLAKWPAASPTTAADDYLSARCPVVDVPMDLDMYAHPATQEEPAVWPSSCHGSSAAEGKLARTDGQGRMVNLPTSPPSSANCSAEKSRKKGLSGQIVTAGATIKPSTPCGSHEPLDGRMGYAVRAHWPPAAAT